MIPSLEPLRNVEGSLCDNFTTFFDHGPNLMAIPDKMHKILAYYALTISAAIWLRAG